MKRLVKRIVFGASFLAALPLIVVAKLEEKLTKGEGLFVGSGQLLALIPGKLGSYIRSAYYFGTLQNSSWEVHIGFGSFFSHRSVSLGSNLAIGAYCVIGSASIGDGVMMASRVSIPSGKRQHFDDQGRLTSSPIFEKVAIGKGAWIGEGAIIMANVGSGCVVSAGAVLIGETPCNQLVGGNPGKIIKALEDAKRY